MKNARTGWSAAKLASDRPLSKRKEHGPVGEKRPVINGHMACRSCGHDVCDCKWLTYPCPGCGIELSHRANRPTVHECVKQQTQALFDRYRAGDEWADTVFQNAPNRPGFGYFAQYNSLTEHINLMLWKDAGNQLSRREVAITKLADSDDVHLLAWTEWAALHGHYALAEETLAQSRVEK